MHNLLNQTDLVRELAKSVRHTEFHQYHIDFLYIFASLKIDETLISFTTIISEVIVLN